MAINISPNPIPSVTRSGAFNTTLNITGDDGETIESVEIIPNFNIANEPNIVINGNNISGYYISSFNDICSYISAGSSDKIETPITVTGIGNVPADKCIFKFIQDTSQGVTLSYTVRVSYSGDSGGGDIIDPETGEVIGQEPSNPFTATDDYTVTHYNANSWTTPGQQLKAHIDNYVENYA